MTLPVSIGWERALLATALLDPETMDDASDVLPSDMSGCHQIIWSEMVPLHRRGTLGARSLVEALRSSGALDTLGFDDLQAKGERYINALATYRGEEMPEYARQVISASTKRQLAQTAALIKIEAEDQNIQAEEALDNAERRVMALRRTRSMEGVTMADLMMAVSGRLNDPNPPGNIWRPVIPELQRIIDFAEAEDFILIAARPGEGKSMALRYEIGMPAILKREPGLFINMENSEIEVARSFLGMVTGINTKLIKSGNLDDWQREKVVEAIDALATTPLYIVTLGSPSAAEVERRCRYYISKHKVQRIGIDYIQLMSNGHENPVQDLTISSGVLRSVALNFGVPVIAAAQLSRAIETRSDDTEPQLADLRQSGSLENDATMVIFPRQVWRNPSEMQLRMYSENIEGGRILPNALPVKMFIKKNRNGPTGVTEPFLWLRHCNRYKSLQTVELN